MVSARCLVAEKGLLGLEFMPFMGKNQKKSLKSAFFFKKIWSVQKIVVSLQPLSEKRIFGVPENFNFGGEREHGEILMSDIRESYRAIVYATGV